MEEEKNYLTDVEKYFDFDAIVTIIKALYKRKKKVNKVTFDYNDRQYTITIHDDYVDIQSDCGRKLRISLEFSNYYPELMEYMGPPELEVVIQARYKIFDNTSLSLKFWHGSALSKDLFINGIDGENIHKIIHSKYFITDGVDYDSFSDRMILSTKNPECDLEFTDEGIRMEDGTLVSNDCEKILLFEDKEAPTREEIESFDPSIEKEKYRKLIDKSNLLPRVKLDLSVNSNIDASIDYYNELKYIYNNTLPDIKSAIQFRELLKHGSVRMYTFSKDEMNAIIDRLTKALGYSESKENKCSKRK